MTLLDAIEQILAQAGGPLHYVDIRDRILLQGIYSFSQTALTPERTVNARLNQNINKEGASSRFERLGQGCYKLRQVDISSKSVAAAAVEAHNTQVATDLRDRLISYTPGEFEDFVGDFLIRLGFEDVDVTPRANDRGVDARGKLLVADVVEVQMAVQAKRWAIGKNVQRPEVQRLRGSIGPHEMGLVVTTSDFSPGARKEAIRSDADPISLMAGDQLVRQMIAIEHLVTRDANGLLELA